MSANTTSDADAANSSDDYENRGPTVLVVTIVFTALSFIFTLLRSLSRLCIVGRWKLDDWSIVLAWAIAFGFSFSICWAVRNGLGIHSEFNPAPKDVPLRASEYVFSVLYNPVLMATKTSICLFYLSIAKEQRFFRWGVWTTMAIVNLAGIALTLVNAFQCHPANAIIMQVIPAGTVCIDQVAIYLASAPVNIVTDLALLLLPMPMLTGMRMPRKQKVILIITFGFGLFVTVVDIVRIVYLQDAFQSRVDELSEGSAVVSELLNVHDDFAWYASFSFMWSAVEVHIGIMCANVPGLKPLAARLLPTFIYDTQSQVEGATWRRTRARNFFRRCLGREKSISDPLQTSPDSSPIYGGGSIHNQRTLSSTAPMGPEVPLAQIRSHDFASESEYPASPLPKTSGSDERRPSTIAAADEHRSSNTESPAPSRAGSDDQHPMDFVAFITAPETTHGLTRTVTARTNATIPPRSNANPTFFDFYNIGNRKCMTQLSDRESLLPNALVTVLFFLWGLSYGFLSQLNERFELVAGLNNNQSIALHSAYYIAYLVAAPTVGQLVLRKVGFKMTFICGLCIYGVGCLIFWPSAVLVSFPAFLISNFVVGFGVAVLETSANPFVALCGSSKYAETRLNISQGVQAVGTVIAQPLAQRVLFAKVTTAASLVDVQWTYLAIALFDVLLAVIFYYIPLPEASEDDFEAARLLSLPESRRISEDDRRIPRYAYNTFVLASLAMFAYVGGQEVIAVNFQPVVNEVLGPDTSPKARDWQIIGYGTLAIGRFATAALTTFLPPWTVLTFLYGGVIVCSSLAVGLQGRAVPTMLVLYELFQGGIFPLIYAIGVRGLGRYTKWGAVVLTAAISGGAIWPLMSAGVNAARNYQAGMTITIAAMALGVLYPLCLGIYAPARHMVNPKNSSDGKSPRARKSGTQQERKEKERQVMTARLQEAIDESERQKKAASDAKVMPDFERGWNGRAENRVPRHQPQPL